MTQPTEQDKAAQVMPVASHWVLDKRLNIAALIGFVLTAASFIWYAAQSDARLATVEATVSANAGRIAGVETKTNSLELTQFRIGQLEATTGRIEAKVDKLVENSR